MLAPAFRSPTNSAEGPTSRYPHPTIDCSYTHRFHRRLLPTRTGAYLHHVPSRVTSVHAHGFLRSFLRHDGLAGPLYTHFHLRTDLPGHPLCETCLKRELIGAPPSPSPANWVGCPSPARCPSSQWPSQAARPQTLDEARRQISTPRPWLLQSAACHRIHRPQC